MLKISVTEVNCSAMSTIRPKYSTEMHQNTSSCAELNGEHAGEDLMPLRSRASSNMLTGGAIAPAVEQIAPPPPPVTKICPPSESLKFG